MDTLVVLLAAEADEHGRLGKETIDRVDAAGAYLREHSCAEIFFASWAIGHAPGGYAPLVVKRLLDAGVGRLRVNFKGKVYTTIDEIGFAEAFLRGRVDTQRVVVVTSWYHVPRVKLEWYLHYRRWVTAVPAGRVNAYTLYRAVLELPKALFMLCSSDVQKWIGDWARRLRVHQ